MALDKDFDGNSDIAQFLEKFKEQPFPAQDAQGSFSSPAAPSVRPAQYVRSFEKLEQKIHELEEKFEASTTQNQLILSELARTREVVERQKDKDAFLEHLSRTIATLRTSVENLSRTQQENSFAFRDTPTQRSFDPLPSVFAPTQTQHTGSYPAIDTQAQLEREREEQTRRFNSLRQKASQLKAVNSALDREIKKAQQEKLEALKKSADQAKEILSLRDQLSAAEERFKSFDFEGRIISIKQEYQEKVNTLESRLKEMSDTCVQQVEQIESLKAENIKLQQVVAEKESLQAQLADKDQQLAAVKQTIASLQSQNSGQNSKRLAAFTAQLRTLEEQRDRLAVELEQSQMSLESVRREKELLEKNFQELVVKINQNDGVIGQLKEKIEVLGKQNAQLAQHNEELTKNNQVLSQDNATLSQNNAVLTQRNASLTEHNEQLNASNAALSRHAKDLEGETISLKGQVEKLYQNNQELSKQAQDLGVQKQTLAAQVDQLNQDKQALARDNKTLAQNNKNLSNEHSTLQEQAQNWKSKLQNLSQENQQLRSQSAALLAARIVQEHSQKQAQLRAQEEQSSKDKQPQKPASPVLHSLGRKVSVSTADEEWEVISASRVAATASSSIKSEADLPEIKVAQSEVHEPLFDGEDFLEKTDSFIGRMKWSIFRENR